MKFTFGIITSSQHSPQNQHRIRKIIRSIKQEEIPSKKYEILIVGDYTGKHKNTKVIPFDETQKQNWITRKKNIIVEKAKFPNIVFLHDYVVLVPGWYQGWLKYGDDWDVCMNVIQNKDGSRFRDWIVFDDLENPTQPRILYWHRNFPEEKAKPIAPYIPDYNYDKTQYMYVSGTYWVAKKEFMQKNPLDEKLCWGEPEDIEWSMRVRDNWKYKFNMMSAVQFLKQKDPVWKPFNPLFMSHEYITQYLIKPRGKNMESKTIFVNIDGTIIQHENTEREQFPTQPKLISPSINRLCEWNNRGFQIILTSTRKERYRKRTEQQLDNLGVPYDILIMGIKHGEQILINNMKPKSDMDTCNAFSPAYNQGLDDIIL